MATIWKTWLEHDDNADNEGVVGNPGGEQLLQRPATSFLADLSPVETIVQLNLCQYDDNNITIYSAQCVVCTVLPSNNI